MENRIVTKSLTGKIAKILLATIIQISRASKWVSTIIHIGVLLQEKFSLLFPIHPEITQDSILNSHNWHHYAHENPFARYNSSLQTVFSHW